jgi:hypothetical protein
VRTSAAPLRWCEVSSDQLLSAILRRYPDLRDADVEDYLVPAGARHGFTNVGEEALRVLAAFSDPAPTVEYEGEPGTLKIGARGGRRRDDHRVFRVKE